MMAVVSREGRRGKNDVRLRLSQPRGVVITTSSKLWAIMLLGEEVVIETKGFSSLGAGL